MAAVLQLSLIGELTVVRDDQAQALPASKKTRALLAYLAVTGRPQLREKLCGILWDGPDDPRAALRWSLTKLRPLVDDDEATRLVADRERVELVPAGAAIDLAVVRAAVPGGVAAGIPRAATDALRAAAAHIRGELLEGLELPDCYKYDEWLRAERESARRFHVSILAALVERLRTAAPADALDHARAWLGLAPLDDAAHMAAMRLYLELDRKADALAQYASCARMFERELGRGPSREIERLRMAIGSPPTAPTTVAVAEPQPLERVCAAAPLVGRVQERAALVALLDAPVPRLVLVLGDPGIGKTRLLDELDTIAHARGLLVLRGRGVEAEQVRPYGAWLDAFAAAGHDPLRDLTATARLAGAGDERARLFDAITTWLVERAGAGLVVIADDIQWLDEASAALLHYVARSGAAGVRIACGARPGELADNQAALRMIRGLTRDGGVQQIGLSPLGDEETAALAAAHAPGIDVARVVSESGGHPLFAVEIARALARGETTWASLEALLAERLELLDGTAREIVPWAAALGNKFTAETLAAITALPLAELGRAITELERRALVRVAGSEWDFAHDLLRGAAYAGISEPRRRLLHTQIARALATLADPDGARAIEVAHHANLGGDSSLCANASLAASMRCMRLFAFEDAAALADRGLAHTAMLVGEERIRLRIDLIVVALQSDMRSERRGALARELERAIVDARAAGCHAIAARGHNEMSRVCYARGDYTGAADSSIAAMEDARTSSDPIMQARSFAYSAQCLAMLGKELPEAEALAGEAAQLLARSPADIPELPFALALIRHRQADLGAAITLLRRAIEVAERCGVPWMIGSALGRCALISLQRARPHDALEFAAEMRTNRGRFGDAAFVPFGALVDVIARRLLGDDVPLEPALAALRAADGPALLAEALTCLAQHELIAGDLEGAHAHATEALTMATRAGAHSEIAVASVILARIAGITGTGDVHVPAIDPDLLDARARAALADFAN